MHWKILGLQKEKKNHKEEGLVQPSSSNCQGVKIDQTTKMVISLCNKIIKLELGNNSAGRSPQNVGDIN